MMENTYLYFPDPLSVPLVMQPDLPPGLPPIPGVAAVHPSGRPGVSFTIPASVATGTGVAILAGDGYAPSSIRGTIYLDGPNTYVRWDDVHYTRKTALPKLVANGKFIAQDVA